MLHLKLAHAPQQKSNAGDGLSRGLGGSLRFDDSVGGELGSGIRPRKMRPISRGSSAFSPTCSRLILARSTSTRWTRAKAIACVKPMGSITPDWQRSKPNSTLPIFSAAITISHHKTGWWDGGEPVARPQRAVATARPRRRGDRMMGWMAPLRHLSAKLL